MKPRFVGQLDFAPLIPETPNLWQLEQPFAQITKDGHMIICRPFRSINGASIPACLWPVIGHPFEKDNKFWSAPHDQGYHGDSLVINLKELDAVKPETLLDRLGDGRYVYDAFEQFRVRKSRRWYDKALWQGMGIMSVSLPKRIAVYSGVRIGGWGSWEGK